ncbi:NAD(P)-dependent oxidoreductase [Opitutia bacterium KCR 482]|nr:NAD(P)-dependent oxidoreductase [Opitutae bacterium KCR 482]
MSSENKKLTASGLPRMDVHECTEKIRITDDGEAYYGITKKAAMAEASRCLHCPKPRCQIGCPNHINIPEFVYEIANGNVAEAAKKLAAQSTMSAICGRLCNQSKQCEGSCVLGIRGKPVAIGALERFAADYVRINGHTHIPECKPPTGKHTAIIGLGPAGITAAEKLSEMGHAVEVFEGRDLPGGVTMYGIPEFRLPREIVFERISRLEKMGVNIHYGIGIGEPPYSLDELRERYDSVLVATGAWRPITMYIAGEYAKGVYTSNEFLARFNLSTMAGDRMMVSPIHAENVITIGGGNVAIDTSRVALRCGAKSTVVYRRSVEEMPARADEIEIARSEGVEIIGNTLQKKILYNKTGNVYGIECVKTQMGEPDASGRRVPVEIEGSEFVLNCDTVILSTGSKPRDRLARNCMHLKLNPNGTIAVDPQTLQTSMAGVFACGDVVTGPLTIVGAMVQAKQAAESMDKYLRGELQ